MDSRTKKIGIFGATAALLLVLVTINIPVQAGTGLTAISGPSSVTTNSWTNNTNAYGVTDNNVYATAAPGKNGTVTGDWGTYGFDSSVPVQASITKVEIIPQYKVSTTGSVASIQVQAVVSGTACPTTALSQATEPTTDTEFIADVTSCRTWTRANLLDGAFRARVAAVRGNTNTAVTFSLDYVKVRITYSVPDYAQSGWRVYQNTNSTDVGSALAAQNTPATLANYGDEFRLRMLAHVTSAQLPAATEQFKLQYAGKGAGSCAAPSGTPSSYTDVSASTLIAFRDNAAVADDAALTANAADPTHSTDTIVSQSYVEANPITTLNTVAIAADGKWDFSLIDNNAPSSTTYCLRMIHGSGTALETYTTYPEITTAVGILSADIVDGSGVSVGSPATGLTSTTIPFDCTSTSGTLGTTSQKIRISNSLSTTGWTVSVAPTAGTAALWSGGGGLLKYDFNDASGSGCYDGADGDIYSGQMSIDAASETITPKSGCTTTGVSPGSSSSFVEGSINSITLLSANATSSRGCYWDLTDIGVTQNIPANQSPGSYSLNLTITILAN